MQNLLEYAYRFRGVLMAPLYIVLVTVFLGETEHDAWVWSIGLSVFFSGVAIRIWAQTHLHYRLRVHKILTRTGPYACVRNPIYIANTLMLLGLTIVSELLWFLPIMLIWCCILYSFVVRREERHLTEKYGVPYVQFMTDTPRWMPHLRDMLGCRGIVFRFLPASLVAESHCTLLLIPLVAKEWFSHAGY